MRFGIMAMQMRALVALHGALKNPAAAAKGELIGT